MTPPTWVEAPAGRAAPGRAGTAAAYVLVLVLAVHNAVWGAFLLPLRVGGVLVPFSLLMAGVCTAVLGVAGARVLRSRAGSVAPGVLWVVLALIAGSKRSEGDLVIAGGEGTGLATLGLLYLVAGAIGAATGYGLSPVTRRHGGADGSAPGARPISTSPEGPARR